MGANIKDSEIVMVNAALFALEYQEKHPYADTEEIIREVINNLNTLRAEKELKRLGIAASNEILKIKKQNKFKNNKQLLQSFINSSNEFLARVNSDE